MSEQIGAIVEGEIQLSQKEKQILLSKLNKLNDAGVERMKGKIGKWRLIRNYIQGYNWADRNGKRVTAADKLLGGFKADGNVDDEPYVNNVMMRIHMSNMQRLGRFYPEIEVDPDSGDLKDKQGARRTKVFLNDLMDRNRYKQRLARKRDRIICMYGAVYMKTMMDPNRGQIEAKPILNDMGQITGWEDLDGTEGEITLDMLAPKNIVLPPFCVDVSEADYLFENNVRTTDYVLRRYQVTVKSQVISKDVNQWFRLDDGSTTRDDANQTSASIKEENLCVVTESWFRRSVEFPLGAHIIWCGREILKSTTLEDHYYDIPYEKAEFIYDDEDPDGDTPYWFMIPMQDALNRVEADIRRHQIMMTKPKWQQHMETILQDPDGITNETAQVLRWTGDKVPGIIQAPDLPQTVFTWRDMVLGEMMSLGAAHDIVRPSQPRSGTAIAYEQEQDDTTLAPTIWSIGVMHETILGIAARLGSQYYVEPRQFSMRDPRGRMTHQIFDGAQMNGNFKVRVNMQSGLPANKIARQQLIVQLKNQQIITAEDAKQFFEFGQESEAIRQACAGIDRAEKIITYLEDGGTYPLPGQPPTEEQMCIEPFDDLMVMQNQLRLAMQENWDGWSALVKQQFKHIWADLMLKLVPPMPTPGAPGAKGGQAPLDPGAKAPMAPPGMSDSAQNPENQPNRPIGGDQSDIYNIPGMEDAAPAPAMA